MPGTAEGLPWKELYSYLEIALMVLPPERVEDAQKIVLPSACRDDTDDYIRKRKEAKNG
jgi:hypothetical protein